MYQGKTVHSVKPVFHNGVSSDVSLGATGVVVQMCSHFQAGASTRLSRVRVALAAHVCDLSRHVTVRWRATAGA